MRGVPSETQPVGPVSGERKVAGFEVGLLHEAGSMDLVVQYDHCADAAGCLADRDLNGGEEVRRAFSPREGGMAHRARHNHRRLRVYQEIQDEGRLLYGIGALGNDDAPYPIVDAGLDLFRELDQVFEAQLRAGHLP